MRLVVRAVFTISMIFGLLIAGVSSSYASDQSRAQSRHEILIRGAFLKAALDRIDGQLENHMELATLFEQCPSRKNVDQECELALTVLRNLPEVVTEARRHLALGYLDEVTQAARSNVSEQVLLLNFGLYDLKTIKAEHWQPLTPVEQAQAKVALNGIIANARGVAKRKYPNDQAKAENLTRLIVHHERVDHLRAYSLLLSQLPLLTFLTKPVVASADVRSAITKIKSNLAMEKQRSRERRATLYRWIRGADSCARDVEILSSPMIAAFNESGMPRCIYVPSSLFAILDYSSVVKGLEQETTYWKKAFADLKTERLVRAIASFMIALPVTIVVFAVAPPLLAVGLGIAGTASSIYQANQEVRSAEQQEFVRVIDPEGEANLDNVKAARQARVATYVVAPLAFTGLGGFGISKLTPRALAVVRAARFKMLM